jgi:hypothetical protein
MARRGTTALTHLVRKLGAPTVAAELGTGVSTIWRWISAGPPTSRLKDIERLAARKMRPKPAPPKVSARRQLERLASDIGAQLIGHGLRLSTAVTTELLARPSDLFTWATATALARKLRVTEADARRWLRQPERIRSLIRTIGIKRTAIRTGLSDDTIKLWLRRPAPFLAWAEREGVTRLAEAIGVTETIVRGWRRDPRLLRAYVRRIGLDEIARRQGVTPGVVRDWARRPQLPEAAREGVRKIAANIEKGRKGAAARKENEQRKREQARAAAEARKSIAVQERIDAEDRVDEHMDWSFQRPRPKSTLDPEETKPVTHPVREDKKRAIELPPLKTHQVLWPDDWKRRPPPMDSKPTQPGFTRRGRGRKSYLPIDLPPFQLEWMKRRRAIYGHTFEYLDSEHFGKQIDEITPTGKESPAIRDLAKMILDARDSHERTRGATIGVYVVAHRWIPDHGGYHLDSDIAKPVLPEYETKVLQWHVEPHGNLNIITNERDLINQLTGQLSTLHEKNTTRFLVLQGLRVRFYTSTRARATT